MNERKYVIVIMNNDEIEVWGGLTRMCRFHDEFSYHYLKSLVKPNKSLEYKGWTIRKVDFN